MQLHERLGNCLKLEAEIGVQFQHSAIQVSFYGVSFSLAGESQIYWWGLEILERKIRDHKNFDNQNVRVTKMTTDSVFILFKD